MLRGGADRSAPLTAAAVRVRLAAPDDAAALAGFAAITFTDTYAAFNAPEHMEAHIAESFGVPQQTAELQDESYATLLLEIDGALVGFAQLRRHEGPSSVSSANAIELHRFYVATVWQGRGVAASLMSATVSHARLRGASAIWLGVWERNPRAIAFYAKHGFRDVGETVFMVGPDRQTDRVLVLDLGADAAV